MAHPLKTYRAAHDKTLADLAAEVGSAAATISRIENGKWIPSPELAIRLEGATKGAVTRRELRPDLWG